MKFSFRREFVKTVSAVLLLFGTYSLANAQSVHEVVHFPTGVMPSVDTSSSTNTETPTTLGAPIWGHLGRPEGQGPHPAIVLLHGCGGIQQSHFNWARQLNKAGYVTLVVDSFRPRSVIRQCDGDKNSTTTVAGRVLDAYGALEFLTTQPYVDQTRVGLIGWSHGGETALAAVSKNGVGSRFQQSFKAVATLYPYCNPGRDFSAPVMVLIGEKDHWTPASECSKLAENNAGEIPEVELVLYPDAFHAFDDPTIGSGFFIPGALGQRHWLQYDPKAFADAKKRLISFFSSRL
ncbi:putative dienelactone hydrolase [Roseibium album]|nr:putative dienelactone hydrolase [Roseibium album]